MQKNTSEKPAAITKYGTVEGVKENGINVFKGIPYAKPPTEERRFKAPEEPDAFTEIYKADKYAPTCHQLIQIQFEKEDENCLYLNVYAPDTPGLKPVMVFIHGGSFLYGSGSQYIYYGHGISSHGIVTVTFNYRLGAFGALDFSAMDSSLDSNICLKDQAAAIKWVYENIEAFGGDRENITLCGQSAGAISTMALINAPSVQNYIKKAIIMSPFPFLYNTPEKAAETAELFLKENKITDVAALREMKAKKLKLTVLKLIKTRYKIWGMESFMPVIDGDFLPCSPLKSVYNGKNAKIPILIGTVENEVDILFKLKLIAKTAAREIQNFLEEESALKADFESNYGTDNKKLAALGRDWFIRMPSEWYLKKHCETAPGYLYNFRYMNPFLKFSGLESFHCCDTIFAMKNFDNPLGKAILATDKNKKAASELADRLQAALADFIKTGNPGWDGFENEGYLKIFDIDGDTELKEGDSVMRKLWYSTKLYNSFFGDNNAGK